MIAVLISVAIGLVGGLAIEYFFYPVSRIVTAIKAFIEARK